MAGRNNYKSAKSRFELKDENAALRATLDMPSGLSIEEWEETMPQELRDQFAARALIESQGDYIRAAGRLGFKGWSTVRPASSLAPLLARIFATPGCRAILERDLAEPKKIRGQLIERQVQIALYGDDQHSTRAFHELAMVCGWKRSADIIVHNQPTTVLAMVTQKDHRGDLPIANAEALPGFLEHEPGAAVRIDSGNEYVHAALEGEI